ncbi:melatonin receptor type 1B-like [Lineus longissimus]|uniref:melatonin receptor type 1B-like n=1 Tax=Lineus longissimus TaxID=88925 RepID=UPI00315D0519
MENTTSNYSTSADDAATTRNNDGLQGAEEYPNFFLIHPELTFIYLTFISIFMMIGNIGNVMVIGAVLSDKKLMTQGKMMIGNIGNVMVIGAVLSDKKLMTQGNVFILNLAIADLTVTSLVDPMSIAGVVLGPKYFNDRPALCKAIGSLCLASCVCSLYSIAAISLNRYILICKNEHYMKIFTWKRTVLYAIALWCCAWSLDIPNYLYWGGHTYDMKTMACSYDRLASFSYTVFFISMFVTLPLFTVLACNVNIYLFVHRSRRRVGGYNKQPEAGSKKSTVAAVSSTAHRVEVDSVEIEEDSTSYVTIVKDGTSCDPMGKSIRKNRVRGSDIRLAKTLFIVFVVFLICWSPYALICLLDFQDAAPKVLYVIFIKLAHTNSSLNSVLYAALNENFRTGYKVFLRKLFYCCSSRK